MSREADYGFTFLAAALQLAHNHYTITNFRFSGYGFTMYILQLIVRPVLVEIYHLLVGIGRSK